MNNQMKPWENNDDTQGEILEAVQTAMLDEDIEECLDFSYDGFQVVRREFFAHIFEPSITFNNAYYEKIVHIQDEYDFQDNE